jgi:hypothetical protein
LLLLCVSAIVPEQAGPEGEEPVIEAERMVWCGPGWQTALYASGFAHQHVSDTCNPSESSRLIRLNREQIQSLRKAAKLANFCTLPERLEPETFVTDEDFLTITLRFPDLRCKVSASGLERVKDRAIAGRFSQIWTAITRLVPEPPQ